MNRQRSDQVNNFNNYNTHTNDKSNNNPSNKFNNQQTHSKQHLFKNNHNNNSSDSGKTTRHTTNILSISKIKDYPQPVVYGSIEYPIPQLLTKQPKVINDIQNFPQRQCALLKQSIGFSNVLHRSNEKERKDYDDLNDPIAKIIVKNRQSAKTFKLGISELDINKKPSTIATSSNRLLNKVLNNEQFSTPILKRNRDELVIPDSIGNSSIKKNKRMLEIQDTTMELSFEGKAMDKSDLVKLVDSSGIMADDDSNIPQIIDTKNLLQSTEFNFQFK
ncbi:hypothetical protein WICMUC_001202 [Wickerhamomyces mucosus]|uniref:Uncharacterized protein n=1 Tax=Wickerhamomyces mucosus TaxID=1378264 RepID=A0A9P8THV0_9ASCO|nr:hypothetical protein WICMUC_001202 [Wickerhamomyces mucosus]